MDIQSMFLLSAAMVIVTIAGIHQMFVADMAITKNRRPQNASAPTAFSSAI